MNGRKDTELTTIVSVCASHALASDAVLTPGTERLVCEHVLFTFLGGGKLTGQAAGDCLSRDRLTALTVIVGFVGVDGIISDCGFVLLIS